MRNRLINKLVRGVLVLIICCATPCSMLSVNGGAQRAVARRQAAIPYRSRAALGRISSDSLRGHLSFISSDALEGRGTPSRGLDLAAEYIAAQFRRAGLEAAGDEGYFQNATLTLRSAPDKPIKSRNVAGILRGSDSSLKDTYVIVSAHYDHLGMRATEGDGDDRIFNGANDDGSGTVSVIELAAALSMMKPRPKRSILFMTFCGEERGLLGSRYYGRHPLVPLEKTVAQINLEQMGRTDDTEGAQVGTTGVTGFDYSDVGSILKAAGDATGIKVYKHPRNSDAFFGRSDNQALADVGIPAHTLSVAYEFPDYHGVEDEWEKIDYVNMERVLRAVALSVINIADSPREPKWNEANPRTARYVAAWKKLHGS